MVGHDVAERFRQQRLRIAGSVEPAARRLDDRARALVPRRDVGEQFAALLGFQIELLPGFALEQEVAPPGGERIGPGFDRVNIADRLIGSETCGPAIVVVEAHGPSMPAFLAIAAPDERRRDDVMAIAKNIGPHLDRLTLNALHRITALLDARVDVLDQEPGTRELACRSCN